MTTFESLWIIKIKLLKYIQFETIWQFMTAFDSSYLMNSILFAPYVILYKFPFMEKV